MSAPGLLLDTRARLWLGDGTPGFEQGKVIALQSMATLIAETI